MLPAVRVTVGLVVVGAGVALLPITGDVAQALVSGPAPANAPAIPADRTPNLRLPPSATGVYAPAPAIDPAFVIAGPTLTSAQRQSARQALSADSAFKALAGSRTYTVGQDTPVTKIGSSVVIGDEVLVTLSDPVSATVTLPAMDWPETSPDYTPVQLRGTVTGAATFRVSLDLRSNRASSIEPEDGAKFSNAQYLDANGNAIAESTSPSAVGD